MKHKLFLALLPLLLILGIFVVKTSINAPSTLATTCGQPQASSGVFDFDPTAVFNGQPVTPLAQALPQPALSVVLGESAGQDRWIEVDLTNQRLRAHQGDQIIYSFPISSGKFFPTPTGEYRIWSKFKYTKMEGGIKGTGTYYYLANVPYVMYFYQGFGIHGTYWHNNFGVPMSHGCVNVSIPNAEKLFYWAEPFINPDQNSLLSSKDHPGTRVVVHGRAPR